MRIKLDENMPGSLVEGLERMGHDVQTVLGEGLGGRPDAEVWHHAQHEQRFLVTQNLDFSDVRRFAPGNHAGVMLVRLLQPGRRALAQAVIQAFTARGEACWDGCFLVVTESKLRVRRPPGSPLLSR